MQWSDDTMDDPALYTNRELSWLQFNRRVLSEAARPENPLLERLRFLSITASNLDEFFMVRYAALRAQVLSGYDTGDASDLEPHELLRVVAEDARVFMNEQAEVFRAFIAPALAEAGLSFTTVGTLNASQLLWVEKSFKKDIQPKLAAQAGDKKDQPPLAGRALHICVLCEDKKGRRGPRVLALPPSIPRIWRLPAALGGEMLLLEEILALFAGKLTPGYKALGCWPFRVTRDADFTVPDDVTADIVNETRKTLAKRPTGDVVRLEIAADAPDEVIRHVKALALVEGELIYRIAAPINLTFLDKELHNLDGFSEHRFAPVSGRVPEALQRAQSVFDALAEGDIFLHHPYDSFEAVMRFVREAASDPRVLAIKQTLYRVSGNSPIIKALCDAAENGKRVTVLLEVKARFDEENNIRWGEVLEKAGCAVIYGLPRVKTHSKITLVVRREGEGLRHYVHLGTGNYNDVTAKQYTDMGLLTCDPAMGEDAQAFFNMVTGFSHEPRMEKLVYAPHMLRPALNALIAAETENARLGRPCGIFAKMNSLVDPDIIGLLYAASREGVPIRLIIRGACCLRAGVPDLSGTIEVRSLIGRFLEHSRVFRFENGGEPRVFLSSADWMPRNLNRRLELMFPVTDPKARGRIEAVLNLQWRDNVNAWAMEPDGQYRRVPRAEPPVNAQMEPFAF